MNVDEKLHYNIGGRILEGETMSEAVRVTDVALEDYLDAVASVAPVPGGGGVAALAGSLGCALGCMVAGLSQGKPKLADYEDAYAAALATCESIRARMLELSNADADGFVPVTHALKLPRTTPEEIEARNAALDEALQGACTAPFEVLQNCLDSLEALEELAKHGSKIAVVDVGVASSLVRTAADGAALTVHANARMMSDANLATTMGEKADSLMGLVEVRSREVYITAKLRFS